MILKEYENISLSFDEKYVISLEDVVIQCFNSYNEALNYFNALCSLKPGAGYPAIFPEQFEIKGDYDSSNDQ